MTILEPSFRRSVLFTLFALAACSNGTRNGAEQSSAPQALSPPELHWAPCRNLQSVQCAGLPVPIDPAQPGGAGLTLRIARLPATGPNKKGMLLLIPSGPGAGIDAMFASDSRKAQHLDALRREYDVVTFDPRGVGESNPVRCAPDAVPEPQLRPPGPDFSVNPPSASEFKAIADANAKFFKTCSDLTGPLLRHLSAVDTANDIERLRYALTPDQGLTAYAGSYGSLYAQAYLELYGNRVRTLVLDGLVDHSVDLPTLSARNVESVDDAFGRFMEWCAATASCALHNQDPADSYQTAYAKVPQTRVVVSQLLAGGSDPQLGWPAVAKIIAAGSRGDTSALRSFAASSSPESTSQDPAVRAGRSGLFSGVLCADYGPQADYDALLKASDAAAGDAPGFIWKYWDAWPIAHGTLGVLDCAGWPWPASNPPHVLSVGARPNVMIANATHDPATPLKNALAVWLQIPQARLLIADVDGHQSWILSRCAFEAEWRFLDDASSAETTTVCPK